MEGDYVAQSVRTIEEVVSLVFSVSGGIVMERRANILIICTLRRMMYISKINGTLNTVPLFSLTS
jgi:hypothetical protein